MTKTQMLDRDWYTVKQAADYLQVSTRTIARYIEAKALCASQLVPGGSLRIPARSIEKLLERRVW